MGYSSASGSFTNEQYLDDLRKLLDEANKSAYKDDCYFAVDEMKPDVSIGKYFTEAMMTKTSILSSDKKKIKAKDVSYYKKVGDKYVSIGISVLGEDMGLYKQAQAELEKLIAGIE